MKNILYDGYLGPRLPKEIQLQRVRRVIQEELTPLQRQTLIAYYFQEQTISAIARARGVNKSTVCRTLHRAEQKLRKYLSGNPINLLLLSVHVQQIMKMQYLTMLQDLPRYRKKSRIK